MEEDENLYDFLDRLRNRDINDETCFLCARSVLVHGSTREHVIPRWVQRRYNLWDQRLILLNGSSIQYRNLTVVCCDECNKQHLKPIEDTILRAVEQGAIALRNVGSNVTYLWLSKILYGLLYKEAQLLTDLRDAGSGTIVNNELLRKYSAELQFLQQARGKLEIDDFTPGSVFVFKTQQPSNMAMQWDFTDDVDRYVISVRIGKVGMVAALADGGAQKADDIFPHELYELPLHPLQFREIVATVAYRAHTSTRTPKYITFEGSPHRTIQLPLMGFSLKPLFDDWDTSTYAAFLAHYLGMPYNEVYFPPDRVLSYLLDESGKFRFIPLDD